MMLVLQRAVMLNAVRCNRTWARLKRTPPNMGKAILLWSTIALPTGFVSAIFLLSGCYRVET